MQKIHTIFMQNENDIHVCMIPLDFCPLNNNLFASNFILLPFPYHSTSFSSKKTTSTTIVVKEIKEIIKKKQKKKNKRK